MNTGGFIPTGGTATRLGLALLGSPRWNRCVYPALIPRYMRARTDNDRRIVREVGRRARTREGAGVSAALWRSFGAPAFDLRAEAPRLAATPTLIVWGTRDVVFPKTAPEQTRAAIPGSSLVTRPTGHVVFSSDPEGFPDAVRPFLRATS